MGETILIVEDEPDSACECQWILDDEGYHAVIAASGATAATEAASLAPAAILLDLMMAPVSGWDVAAQLRANPATARIPVIVMSAIHRIEERAAEIGTPYVLAKPFNLADLLRAVERALSDAAA